MGKGAMDLALKIATSIALLGWRRPSRFAWLALFVALGGTGLTKAGIVRASGV